MGMSYLGIRQRCDRMMALDALRSHIRTFFLAPGGEDVGISGIEKRSGNTVDRIKLTLQNGPDLVVVEPGRDHTVRSTIHPEVVSTLTSARSLTAIQVQVV